jgi:hypothetical protein
VIFATLGKDEQKGITTGSRICCYKIYKLAFQAIGLLIFLFIKMLTSLILH